MAVHAPIASLPGLTVGARGDAFEREADRVADQVVSRNSAPAWGALDTGGGVRVQRLCESADEEVRRQPIGHAPSVSPAAAGRIAATRGGGEPLSAPARAFFEPRFGHSLENVRVHHDGEAQALAEQLRARAFTVGNDVYFGAGQYAPTSGEGRRLLAHELTHTLQQGGLPRSAQRVQLKTDAEYEASIGPGDAISKGTMKAVSGVDGTTFTAKDCGGKTGCEVSFKFNRAFIGDYKFLTGGGGDLRGAYVSIDMSYTSGKCGACGEVKPIQILQNVKKASGSFVAADPQDPTRRERSGWGDDKAPSRGWRVDALTTDKSPFYVTSEWDGQSGSSTKPAVLRDAPADWKTDTNAGKEFRSCAVCYNGGKGHVLGCIDWGYYINDKGAIAFRPSTPTASCGAPAMFTDAVKRFEGIKGNEKANIGP